MGTLGCINDMMRRDKENRELRHRSRERMKDTHQRLLDTSRHSRPSQTSLEEMEERSLRTSERTSEEQSRHFRFIIFFLACTILIAVISYAILFLF